MASGAELREGRTQRPRPDWNCGLLPHRARTSRRCFYRVDVVEPCGRFAFVRPRTRSPFRVASVGTSSRSLECMVLFPLRRSPPAIDRQTNARPPQSESRNEEGSGTALANTARLLPTKRGPPEDELMMLSTC